MPNALKFLATTGKFDSQDIAKRVNVDASYPQEPALIQTLGAWAEISTDDDQRIRDSFDLFCLRFLLEKNAGFEFALLLRNDRSDIELDVLRRRMGRRLFLVFGSPMNGADNASAACNVLFRINGERCERFLAYARELYLTGAVYGLAPYSFEEALAMAVEAVEIQDEMRSRMRSPK